MQAAIEIPIPTDSDSDTVVTALETAAVFRAKGDTAEAIRWLQRAAESAGEAGDDARTLTLARTAADLTRSLQDPPTPEPAQRTASEGAGPKRLPKPPPRQSSSFPAATARPNEEASQVTASTAQATSTRPPPPSTRVLPSTPLRSTSGASGTAGTASVAPRPVLATKSSIPSAERRRPSSVTPAPSSVTPVPTSVAPKPNSVAPALSSVTPAPSSVAPRAVSSLARAERRVAESNGAEPLETSAEAPAERPTPEEAPPSKAPTPSLASAPAENSSPSSNSVRAEPPPKPVALRAQELGNGNQRLRAAARVSVVASSTEPGLFFVRVLDDSQPPPSSSTEALMVLLDPNSTLFSS